jgi:glycosyltransferase involved in cell wall biosynthesis
MMSSANTKESVPRIVFVTSFLDLGGSTTWLCDLAGELCKRQIPVRVFSLMANHPLAAEFHERGIDVLVQQERRLIYEERLQAILEAMRDFQPTTAVGWTGTPSYEALRYVPQGILKIGVLHSDYLPVYQGAKPYVPSMDRVVVLSSRMAEEALSCFQCAPGKILHLRLGVEVPNVPRQLDHGAGQPLRILYLGRVQQEQKRAHLFPEILRDLCATGMPFVWTIAGDGPERTRLEKVLGTNNPTQTVRVVGSVTYSKIPALLEAHDVFLLASDYEGLPHTLLEAMGYGLVPVVSDLPSGIREVVDETTGRLVNVNDIAGYARSVHWLHTHRQEMTRMSRAAEQRVRDQFSIHAMTDQWLTMAPAQSAGPANWPRKFAIRRPLVHPWPWAFFEPFRTARRVVKRLSASA